MSTQQRNILAADIGGTNSRFAHFTLDGRRNLELLSNIWIETEKADSFGALLQNLKESEFPLEPENADIVSIAVAGPITRGAKVSPPLIPWEIDLRNARTDYGFQRSILINDFVAQAFSCISPSARSAEVILPGEPEPLSSLAVIGAGTGLGKAILVPDDRGGYDAAPSEGAHACFPFVGEEEFTFQDFLIRYHQTGYPTCNHVVSGRGLTAIHEFLTGNHLEPAQVATSFPDNPTTLSWTARFYARACRNFALETLARGGLYITGGIAARNPDILFHESFRKEFLASDTMSDILSHMPVYLMKDQNSGLWGAALMAARELSRDPS